MQIPNKTTVQDLLAAQRQAGSGPNVPCQPGSGKGAAFFPWDQVQGRFGVVPGRVFIEDFDLGVVRTLGAYVDPHAPVEEASFILPVPGLKPEEQREDQPLETVVVPVTFANAEAFQNIWKLPGIFIRREQLEPDMSRYSQELEAFRVPAPNTQMVNGSVQSIDPLGPAEVMSWNRAEAYNIYYVIDMIARYRTDANALLKVVLAQFKQNKAIIVQDDLGDYNEYTAFLESIDQLDEVLGLTMKHHGWALTLKVVAELDLSEREIRPTATSIRPEVVRKPPGMVAPVLTTTDGLPLKNYKSRVLGTICSMVPRMK